MKIHMKSNISPEGLAVFPAGTQVSEMRQLSQISHKVPSSTCRLSCSSIASCRSVGFLVRYKKIRKQGSQQLVQKDIIQ